MSSTYTCFSGFTATIDEKSTGSVSQIAFSACSNPNSWPSKMEAAEQEFLVTGGSSDQTEATYFSPLFTRARVNGKELSVTLKQAVEDPFKLRVGPLTKESYSPVFRIGGPLNLRDEMIIIRLVSNVECKLPSDLFHNPWTIFKGGSTEKAGGIALGDTALGIVPSNGFKSPEFLAGGKMYSLQTKNRQPQLVEIS